MNKGSLPGSLFRLPTASNKDRHAGRPPRRCFGASTPITAVILSVDVFISVFQGDWSGAWEAVKLYMTGTNILIPYITSWSLLSIQNSTPIPIALYNFRESNATANIGKVSANAKADCQRPSSMFSSTSSMRCKKVKLALS